MEAAPIEAGLLRDLEEGVQRALRGHPAPGLRILGYGEISTVLELATPQGVYACKRLPPFPTPEALQRYMGAHRRYVELIEAQLRVRVPETRVQSIETPRGPVAYTLQRRLDPRTIGHRLLHTLPAPDAPRLCGMVMERIRLLSQFNRDPRGPLALGLDAQISNWALHLEDPCHPTLRGDEALLYLDTSTPLIREHGEEVLDTAVFLQSLPRLLRPLARRLYLREILDRYYEPRRILRDLIANLHKEKRGDLVEPLIETANRHLGEMEWLQAKPLTPAEVEEYYRKDARMWEALQRMRRLERLGCRMTGRTYPHLLPGKIER
ncbi:MAG: hypothetical protein HY558_03840 [Euryarchaeota archaeon]|nr:hypothetical protein [Euryarchaeota archaeon]